MEPDSPLKNNSDLAPQPTLEPKITPKIGDVANNTARKPSIHTLEGDVFNAMKDDSYGNNIVKVVTNQSNKAVKPVSAEVETRGFLTKFAIIGGVFVVVVGVVLGYFYFTRNKDSGVYPTDPNATTTPETSNTTPLMTKTTSVLEAEAVIEMNLKEFNKLGSVQKIQQVQQDLRDKQIAIGTTVELTLNLTAAEFFAKNQYSGGEGLIRSITNNYSFGLYNNKSNKFESFLVFKLSSPDLAFSNMLSWERYMPTDLEDFFSDTSVIKTDPEREIPATTTPTIVVPGFTDKVLKNTDSRVYTDKFGTVRVVYGFINKEYLIIAGGVESFIDVKTRLLNNITLR